MPPSLGPATQILKNGNQPLPFFGQAVADRRIVQLNLFHEKVRNHFPQCTREDGIGNGLEAFT